MLMQNTMTATEKTKIAPMEMLAVSTDFKPSTSDDKNKEDYITAGAKELCHHCIILHTVIKVTFMFY